MIRQYRRRVGRRWTVDEVFCFRGKQKLYLYRAVDEHGQVIDVLLRDKRDRASAEAFFRQALARTEVTPQAIITDHHQPYVKAVATVIPLARHVGDHHKAGARQLTEVLPGLVASWYTSARRLIVTPCLILWCVFGGVDASLFWSRASVVSLQTVC